jgi:hypothetical protein
MAATVAHVLFGEPATTPDQVRGKLSPGHALTDRRDKGLKQ